MERFTVQNALNKLKQERTLFHTLFKHGTLEIEIYKPEKIDKQQPHSRDELYVVATGEGFFINDGIKKAVEIGEVLFVPAGIYHKFVDFSEDFAVWVFFYGPLGGGKE